MPSGMPVRSLTSFVLRWPDRAEVDRAARLWAAEQRQSHPEVQRIGYFGSYARGDAGVGSDLDLIVIVERAQRAFMERALDWDLSGLPVPAEILVYTREEWDRMQAEGRRFGAMVQRETVWL